MTLPNFLIVGAQKAGTTSVYEYLSQHPDIFMSTPKEPHFFTYMDGTAPTGGHRNPFYKPLRRYTDMNEYQALFAHTNGATALGEASPSYLYSPVAPDRIAEIIPNARVIAILRNPVDRAFSNFQMNRRQGQEPLETFEAALAAEDARVAQGWGYAWHYAGKSRYSAQIARYQARFPPEQLLVLLHDDLVRDPRAFIQRIHAFLDVRMDFEPDLALSSNVSGVPRNPAVALLLRPALITHQYWSPLVPRRLRHVLRGKLLAKASLPPDSRANLIQQFRPDIEQLQQRIDRDLSRWMSEPAGRS